MKHKKILTVILVITAIAVLLAGLWWEGHFLPGWIDWKNESITDDFDQDGKKETIVLDKRHLILKRNDQVLYETPSRWKISSMYAGNIDEDDNIEILVLAWRHGNYGDHRPNWVKHDTIAWSERLYIFEVKNDKIQPQWMSSRQPEYIQSLKLNKDKTFTCISPEGKESVWKWQGWAVYRVD